MYDAAESKQVRDEFLQGELNKHCSPCEFEDFREWLLEESSWEQFYAGTWINTRTRKLIGTDTLYKKYVDARESENI